MSKRIVAALLVAGAGAWLGAPAQADLVQNGGFQDSGGAPSGADWSSQNAIFDAPSNLFQQDSTPYVWFNTSPGNSSGSVWQYVTVSSAGTGTLTAEAMGRSGVTGLYSSSAAGTPYMDLYAGTVTNFSSATPITADSSSMPALIESTSPTTFSKTYDSLALGAYTVLISGVYNPSNSTNVYQVAFDNVSFNVSSVPEPGTLTLLVVGLLGLLAHAWRRK